MMASSPSSPSSASSEPSESPCHNVRTSYVPSIVTEPTLVTSPFDRPLPSGSSSFINAKEDYDHEMASSCTSQSSSIMGYLNQDVAGAHTSVYLLLSFFTSGLIDSVAFNAWSCFVGMQTGRTRGRIPNALIIIPYSGQVTRSSQHLAYPANQSTFIRMHI